MSKGIKPKSKPGSAFFLHPQSVPQRQYEALRAYVVEDLSAAEVAERFGFTPATLYSLARDWRARRLPFSPPPSRDPKPPPSGIRRASGSSRYASKTTPSTTSSGSCAPKSSP